MNMLGPITFKSEVDITPDILINPAYRWKSSNLDSYLLDYTGAGNELAESIFGHSHKSPENFRAEIIGILQKARSFSSGIMTFGSWTVAWVDHIRSYPVFYSVNQAGQIISNDARLILRFLANPESDPESILEFCMTGFVTGQDTLYKNIKCLLPGECLIYYKGDNQPAIKRYNQYLPSVIGSGTEAENIQRIGVIIDKIIQRIIQRADDRPIWIPLSAGLDSRLILCKLHEHGYKNLHTFTYGPRLNFEAIHARRIAKKLNIPWHYVGLSMGECHSLLSDKMRKDYSSFADGLKAAPSMREYTALKYLQEKCIIHSNAIIINGQSGDYITGGHISPVWYEKKQATTDALCDVIIGKHYSLWQTLDTQEYKSLMKEKIKRLTPQSVTTPFEGAAMEESWEYDARQITLVVNGQRSYDFFGYDWELPFWEKDLCDLYADIPYAQKREQSIFKKYLKKYNYQGLFPTEEPKIWRWPLGMLWVVPMARIVGFLCGPSVKKKFYAFMRYFGHYSNQYAFFPFTEHQKTYKVARNIFSLYIRHWFIENKFPIPTYLKQALYIPDEKK